MSSFCIIDFNHLQHALEETASNYGTAISLRISCKNCHHGCSVDAEKSKCGEENKEKNAELRIVWAHATTKEDGRLGAKLQDTSMLPLDVPQSKWFADPTHQTKVVTLRFFSLLKQGKGSSSISKATCLHLKKYWRYMLKQNRGKTIEEMLEAAKAPVDHVFDKHDFCCAWCNQRALALEEKEK
eukprot:15364984-Ditylum_brightwellii.AAC.2